MSTTDFVKAAIRRKLAAGVTVHRIATDAGLAPIQIWRFLHGADMKLSSLDRLAPVLGIRLAEVGS